MSIANISVKIGSKSKNRSATDKIKYVCRLDRYQNRTDLVHSDYGNMPDFAADDPMIFWQSANEFERKNSAVYTEHVLTLPRDLTLDQQIKLVENWTKTELKNKAYQYAIHHSKALDGQLNPHAHLVFSEREQDGISRTKEQFFKRYNSKNPERGGCKKGGTGSRNAQENKQHLLEQRQRFETLTNQHLERANSKTKVSLQSYKNRGLLIVPEPKLGSKIWRNDVERQKIIEFRETKKQIIALEQKRLSLELISLDDFVSSIKIKSVAESQYDELQTELYEALQATIKIDHDLLLLAKKDPAGFLKYAYLMHFDLILNDDITHVFAQNKVDTMMLNQWIDRELRSYRSKLTLVDNADFQLRALAIADTDSFERIIDSEMYDNLDRQYLSDR